ncbi:MAG TPA: hypothetical protein VNZ52_01605 [Candidatus Thermoplasmatota archaeon]|nr:hypothetical protein [Candidatus Thermoplasmatota archaeon]
MHHRRVSSALAALLLLSTALALPALPRAGADPFISLQEGTGTNLHPPIFAWGDEELAAGWNGIRSGSGTAEDPYLISGWTILLEDRSAIALVGTRAHVMIEDIDIVGGADVGTLGTAGCYLHRGKPCPGFAPVHLVDVENVTVRRIQVDRGIPAIQVEDSRHVLLEDLTFTPDPVTGYVPLNAIVVEGGASITLRRITFDRVLGYPLMVQFTENLVLEDSILKSGPNERQDPRGGRGTYMRVYGAVNAVFQRNTFHMGGLILDSDNVAPVIRDSLFEGGAYGVGGFTMDTLPVSDLVVCGNRFVNHDSLALDLYGARLVGARIHGNEFRDGAGALTLFHAKDLRFEDNLVTGAGWRGIRFEYGTSMVAHGNSFSGNAVAVAASPYVAAPLDFTGNWWGHASGPSGHGPGEGDPIQDRGGKLVLSPVLEEAPELSVGCA